MMWWNGGWGWAWLFMVPTMVIVWALVIWAIGRWARAGGPSSAALDQLDERLAAGELDLDEYRSRRRELERR